MERSSRAVTIAAVAAVGVVIGGVLAPSASAAGVTLRAPSSFGIGPGAVMSTQIDARTASLCTADFVFRGPNALYIGMSAHCAGTGRSEDPSGCTAPTLPLGTEVTISGRGGPESTGRLAYSSWVTMQERGEDDPALCRYNDFALVAVDPADAGLVDPSVPLLGGPTGLDTDGLTPGETVYSFQPNNGGSGVKTGRSVADDGSGRSHQVVITPPGVPGDSGSGFLDADGRAVGVLSTEFLDRNHSNGVADLALALAYADADGGLGTVTLVPGTAPFRSVG